MVLVYAAPKLNSSLVTNVLFVQLEDVEGVLMRIELDPPRCILGIFCRNFHYFIIDNFLNSNAYGTAKHVEIRIFIFR